MNRWEDAMMALAWMAVLLFVVMNADRLVQGMLFAMAMGCP